VPAQPRPHRVRDDVAADGVKLVLVLDLPAPEALAEEVTPADVASVETLGIAAVQLLEACGQLREGRLQHEVVVVRHEAERV
jgi:hypothetical protein